MLSSPDLVVLLARCHIIILCKRFSIFNGSWDFHFMASRLLIVCRDMRKLNKITSLRVLSHIYIRHLIQFADIYSMDVFGKERDCQPKIIKNEMIQYI